MLRFYWKFFREFVEKYGRPPYGRELDNIKNLAKQKEEAEKVIDIAPRLPKDAPYSDKNPGGWMEGGLESLKDRVDDLAKQGKEYKKTTVGDFMADYFGMGKKTETEAEMLARMKKENKEAVKRLKKKKEKKTAEDMIDDGDFDPSGMRDGGRIGYGYGTGLKLLKLLKKENLTLKKAIQEAKERFTNYSGDLKYDADAVLDDILDTYGIDRDLVDQYDILDAYDMIYKDLSKSKYQTMYERAAQRAMSGQDEIMELQAKNPGLTEELAKKLADKDPTSFTKAVAPKLTERMELKIKYPGITDELLEMIMKDDDPQRKAEVLASLDEALTMMDKGMDKDQIIDVLRRTTRTKNAAGGLNYLMGF